MNTNWCLKSLIGLLAISCSLNSIVAMNICNTFGGCGTRALSLGTQEEAEALSSFSGLESQETQIDTPDITGQVSVDEESDADDYYEEEEDEQEQRQ